MSTLTVLTLEIETELTRIVHQDITNSFIRKKVLCKLDEIRDALVSIAGWLELDKEVNSE